MYFLYSKMHPFVLFEVLLHDFKSLIEISLAGAVNNCVVIQLDREHSITSVDIGNEFSALVEILVAKSCEQQPSFHVTHFFFLLYLLIM